MSLERNSSDAEDPFPGEIVSYNNQWSQTELNVITGKKWNKNEINKNEMKWNKNEMIFD